MENGAEAETALLKMAPKRPRAVPSSPAEPEDKTASTTVGSPLEALERDEVLRTRAFCSLVMALTIIGGACIALIPGGDPVALKVLLFADGVALASVIFIYYQSLDPVRFRKPVTSLIWFLPAVSVNSAVWFFGVFSPAPMAALLGIYFVGLGKAGRMAVAAYAICAVAHAAMAAVVIAGGRDVGIVHPDLDNTQRLIIQLLTQVMLGITIVIARMSRRSTLASVVELEQAVRLAAHRQALLLEARDELDRALRSKRGRFSEQRLGPYDLGEVLGRGAMGEVYAGVDSRTGGPVAVKLLPHTLLGNPDYALRFTRELRIAASIESPHIVKVIEIGDQPVPYLVMERLVGSTLAEILRERRTLEPLEVVELVAEVGIGVTAASTAGIVHRDLKPQNVFRHGDTWKVLDFGVARAIDSGDTLTHGNVVGTPSYMAPEQARGEPVDHLTDLYALAAIAYRAFTGHPPFAAKDVAETLYRVVHTRPVRPTLLAPHLHPDVDHVLAIGMAHRPTDRFASAAELVDALRAAVRGELSQTLRARGMKLAFAPLGGARRHPR